MLSLFLFHFKFLSLLVFWRCLSPALCFVWRRRNPHAKTQLNNFSICKVGRKKPPWNWTICKGQHKSWPTWGVVFNDFKRECSAHTLLLLLKHFWVLKPTLGESLGVYKGRHPFRSCANFHWPSSLMTSEGQNECFKGLIWAVPPGCAVIIC